MKEFFSLIIAMLAGLSAVAQGTDYAMLQLRLNDRSPIAVRIDGQYFSRQTTTLTLDGLSAGFHRVEVYRVSGPDRRPVRIYTGRIRLDAGTANIGNVDVSGRRLRLESRPMDAEDERPYSDQARGSGNGDRGVDDRDMERQRQEAAQRALDEEERQAETEGLSSGTGNKPVGSTGKQRMLSTAEMDAMRKEVEHLVADTEKERLLKSKLGSRFVTTDQARVLLGWLVFESTRLDFAIWAYDRVTDRENYRKLENTFSNSESRSSFRKGIGR